MNQKTIRARRMWIDTYRQAIVYVRVDSPVVKSEGFEAHARVLVENDGRSIVATLNVVSDGLVTIEECGFSEEAWTRLGITEGDRVHLSHAPPLDSFAHVRGKMFGKRLQPEALREVVRDIASGLYPEIHIAAFLSACAGNRLDIDEISALTQEMVAVGQRLEWDEPMVLDKHCTGGLPGNRTTPIVVAIAAAGGLTVPKTSSRAITSPAGTADVMATITRVDLTMDEMRSVVREHGACLAWGGSVSLSPVDDMLIRVARPLDIDSQGQLVASVLSKKAAAGSTHVLLDIPWGPTAKVRSLESARSLARDLEEVGRRVGLSVTTVLSDGSQPVGRGIGPALEARDVLEVLRCEPTAPQDLRGRALALAGKMLEIGGKADHGHGWLLARELLDEGAAWARFQAICHAQGGLREPPVAALTAPVLAPWTGKVLSFDNRRLARAAKLAGAPADAAAGLELHVHVGDRIAAGEPLFTLHTESRGERDYALNYLRSQPDIVEVEPTEAP